MNCKPGDLAVIRGCVEATECNGMLVTVLANVSGRSWTDPTGFVQRWNDDGPTTAVESLGSDFIFGGPRRRYAVFDSGRVVPLRGDDARDQTLDWLPVPTQEPA